jgi:hypothetical protein
MKKVLFMLTIALTTFSLQAQKLDKAKDLLAKNKLADAQKEIDAFLAVEKNKTNAEAWYTKGKVYNAIAGDPALKSTVPDARATAFDALKQYVTMEATKDSAKRNLSLLLDNNQPFVDLYKSYSADGATFYNANNFNDAFTNFVKTLEVFDFISERKIIPLQFDTTTVLYAGISAEKANRLDDAATYYGKIAERKIKSEGFIEIYKWLASHYEKKNDLASASKYTALGREVYPGDQFWDAFDLETARDKGTKDDLFKKYEQVIAANPNNHLFVFNYGVELYQLGYNQDIKQRPANSKELIAKAGEQFKKVIQMQPDYANAQMVMGQLVYNEGVDINNINKEIRPPAGGKLKPEELKKKEELRKQVTAKFDEALPYFEKVEQILGSKGKLKMEEKMILKDAYDLIITIYENRQNKEKVDEYTNKFNDVDKKHS